MANPEGYFRRDRGRTWAVEGVGGMSHPLARQPLSAGERALDAQPELGARVRLLL